MSWVTKLGASPEAVNYRLSRTCGHDQARAQDVVVDYRLGGKGHIERAGRGWAEFGRQARTTLDSAAEIEEVRQIMAGRHPHTGEVLVKPKVAVHPNARLAARPFIEAVYAAARQQDTTPAALLTDDKARRRFIRLERALIRQGDSHRAPVTDLEQVAQAAGIDLDQVYGAEELAFARDHADQRIRVGNQGYDVTITRPRSIDVLRALAPAAMAERMDELFAESVRQAVDVMEQWCGYALAGHHGDGRRARRVPTTGWAATITWHRTTRPIDGTPGDPHLHAHVMVPNLVKGVDGRWRTVAAGGRDLFRHARAVSEYALALHRRKLTTEYGVRWEYQPTTRQWEIAGVPDGLRRLFSRRSQQIDAAIGADASPAARRAAGRRTAGAKIETTPEQERDFWRSHALQEGWVPEYVVHSVLGYEPPSSGLGLTGVRPPQPPDSTQVAARVWDSETGVTAVAKAADRAQVMAHVAAACPDGLTDQAEWEQLTDAALADTHAVALPAQGQSHLTHADCYTSSTIVAAERTITASATARLNQNTAQVPAPLVDQALSAFISDRGFALSAEQEAVVRRLLTAGHGIDAVIGVAGSGKTTVMDAARRAWQAAGLTVKGAATAAVAAAKLHVEAHIESTTLAAWQQRIASGDGLQGVDVLILDEAAMIDDRALAALVEEAARTGTKLVAIGDPKQLRAVGVGGAFARVHELVNGLVLTENRRQRDAVERSALQVWRDGQRAATLAVWGATGHIHSTTNLHEAYAQMVAAWWHDWSAHPDPHQGIEQALMLAATNSDVDQLNARARVIARADGRLIGPDVTFAQAGGDRLDLAVGDLVRVRRNDYRDDVNVLNGYRGLVRAVDSRRGALIEWRQGTKAAQAWISPEQIARGHLSHGYALTIAAAQGLTSSTCHVLGLGADTHALYPAMSRAKTRSDLYLPAAELEPEDLQLQLGQARTPREQLDRVIAAYSRTLTDADEGMITDRLDGRSRPSPAPSSPASPVVTPAQARAGQGPTMHEAAARIRDLEQQGAQAQLRAEQLHRELVELNARVQGRRFGRRAAQQRLSQIHAALDEARSQHRQALNEAHRLREQALAADLAIARHSAAAAPAPAPAEHSLAEFALPRPTQERPRSAPAAPAAPPHPVSPPQQRPAPRPRF